MEKTIAFIQKLVDYLDGKIPVDKAYKEIRDAIPVPQNENRLEDLVLPYGFSLL
jgi:hypothetical protein